MLYQESAFRPALTRESQVVISYDGPNPSVSFLDIQRPKFNGRLPQFDNSRRGEDLQGLIPFPPLYPKIQRTRTGSAELFEKNGSKIWGGFYIDKWVDEDEKEQQSISVLSDMTPEVILYMQKFLQKFDNDPVEKLRRKKEFFDTFPIVTFWPGHSFYVTLGERKEKLYEFTKDSSGFNEEKITEVQKEIMGIAAPVPAYLAQDPASVGGIAFHRRLLPSSQNQFLIGEVYRGSSSFTNLGMDVKGLLSGGMPCESDVRKLLSVKVRVQT